LVRHFYDALKRICFPPFQIIVLLTKQAQPIEWVFHFSLEEIANFQNIKNTHFPISARGGNFS